MNDLVLLNDRLLATVEADNFSGYDPFDGLNSQRLQATRWYKNPWVRLIWLQLNKRSPFNLRPLLRIPKKRNPKGVGLFISGLIHDYHRTGDKVYLQKAQSLAEWLVSQRSDPNLWTHSCWGYHFDWQARAFYVPAGKPNIITTCYAARALYDLGELVEDEELKAIALDAGYFIAKHLYTHNDEGAFYAYIPGETAFVHNASLWGCTWCAFVGIQLNDQQLVEQALSVACRSVAQQAADGSWVYGARHHHQFIDGFHTGYNLEALSMLRDITGSTEFDLSIDKGYQYYIKTFFTEDAIAKYYNNNIYPIDMHSFSQAVFTLLKVGGKNTDVILCDKVIQQAIRLMYIPTENRFIYQKNRWMTNRVNYIRWTQAWAYYSLSFYNRFIAEKQNAQN